MVAFVQRPAPGFTAPTVIDGTFEDRSLSDYRGKWVVLLFYPMDFTFVCPTEILAFNDALPALKEIDTVVLGISTDSQYAHLAWAAQPRAQGGLGPGLQLPLVADRSMQIARAYGVLLEDEGIALRGLFIIDPAGVLRQSTVNDLPVGRSVEETIRLIKAFQFTASFVSLVFRMRVRRARGSNLCVQDQYGEVCPANWKEGGKTIKADPTAALEYFSSANGATNGNGVPAKRARVD